MKHMYTLAAVAAIGALLASCVAVVDDTPSSGELSIFNAWWTDIVDNDGDNYRSSARLNFDADITSGTALVYADIWYKPSTSSTWTFYFQTAAFSISGSETTDSYWIVVGDPNGELTSGAYDFQIRLFRANSTTPADTRGPADDVDLDGILFETSAQDVASGPTISVFDAWWTDTVDTDADGYNRYGRLNFDVDVTSGTYSVVADVYYKLASSSAWTLYFTTSPFSITGAATADAYYIGVGAPNTELTNGTYDFEIRVRVSGNSTVVATRGPTVDTDLNDRRFETAAQDVAVGPTVSVYNAWWSDTVDTDADGFNRSARLNFDVDVTSGTYNVIADVYYKLASSSTWTLYFTTTAFSITGNSTADAYYIGVGSTNTELTNGTYDFEIRVRVSGSSTVVAIRGPGDDADLNDRRFETAAQDTPTATYSVFNAWWSDTTDDDNDGVTSIRRLNFDVDITSGWSDTVYVAVYRKLSSVSTWTLYFTSADFPISGSSTADARFVAIGDPNTELDSGRYDFEIRAYRKGTTTVVASRGPADDTDLNGQWFETSAQDPYFEIFDVWWYDSIDVDLNGYWRQAKLAFDADVYGGTHAVYARVYYKLSTSSIWSLYYTSSAFTIVDDLSNDSYFVQVGAPNTELPNGVYDFAIDLYTVAGDRLVAGAMPVDFGVLGSQWFETAAQD